MSHQYTYEEMTRRLVELEKVISDTRAHSAEIERIFDLSQDLIGSGSLDGYFTRVNSAFVRIFEYSEREHLDRPFIEFVHDDDVEKIKEALALAVNSKSNESFYLENRHKCKNGQFKWIEWHVLSIAKEFRFIAVGRDVSERKEDQELLCRSEERFKLAGKASYDLIYEWDVRSDSLEWFGDIDAFLGYEKGEISRDIAAWLSLIHPEDSGFLEDAVDLHRVSKAEIQYDYRIRQKDGVYRYFHDHGLPVLDESGCPFKWVGVCTDITRQKQSEIALQQSEEKYRNLVESNPDLHYRTTRDGRIVFISPSVLRLSGYAEEECLGMKMADEVYLYPDEQQLFLSELKRQGKIENFEVRFKRKDGSIWWASTNAHYYRDHEGYVLGIEGIARDVTERKQAELEKQKLEIQLNQQEKMRTLGLMVGGIAHDLNNILQGIVSLPDILLRGMNKDDPNRRLLMIMKNAGHSASDVVSDLLTIARGVATQVETLNLTNKVEEFFESAEFQLFRETNPQILFKANLDRNLLNTECSSTHIRKTLTNLVLNAIEAIAGEGQVVISTENVYLETLLQGYENVKEGEYVLLRIADDGSGIMPSDLPRIFEPFYTKKAMGRSGTGLGLAVVWNTVHEHGGYVCARSDSGGTQLDLYFPVTRKEVLTKPQDVLEIQYMGNGETIMVVDDQESQREIASALLTKLGYDTRTASGGEEAIEFLKDNSVDLIVLDMIMDPGIGGLETYRRILEIHSCQKAIIVSGYSENDQVKEALRCGAGKYVKKPYVLETIGLAVRMELDS